MSIIMSLIAAANLCATADKNHPYTAMQEGFAAGDPEIVASAYHSESAIGGVNPPRIRTTQELPSLFGYVAPDDGTVLKIDFKIVARDVGDSLGADIGLYRISSPNQPASHGRFTTILQCGGDHVWRFIADLMQPADADDWNAAACVDDAPCVE